VAGFGLAVLVAVTIVAAVCIVASLGTDVAGELRSACAPSN